MAPLMAASVSTRVVSWKEAAARKLEVLSEALVTPSSTTSAVAGSPPSARTWLLMSSNSGSRPRRCAESRNRFATPNAISECTLSEDRAPSQNCRVLYARFHQAGALVMPAAGESATYSSGLGANCRLSMSNSATPGAMISGW